MDAVTVIFSCDSPLLEDDAINMQRTSVEGLLRNLTIKRIKELATPDYLGFGNYVIEVYHDSMLIGAKITIIS